MKIQVFCVVFLVIGFACATEVADHASDAPQVPESNIDGGQIVVIDDPPPPPPGSQNIILGGSMPNDVMVLRYK